MAYATLTDMVNRYGEQEMIQLTSGTTAPIEAPVDQALSDASAMIDAAVAGRYQLPFETVPDPLPRWCCDIARFYLWRDSASEQVTALFNAAMKGIQAVANGSLTLDAAGIDAPLTGDAVQLVAAAPREFTPYSFRGF